MGVEEFISRQLEPSNWSSSMVDAVVQRVSRRVQNCLPIDTVLALDALVDATVVIIRRHHLSVQSGETSPARQSFNHTDWALDLAGKIGLEPSASREDELLHEAVLGWKEASGREAKRYPNPAFERDMMLRIQERASPTMEQQRDN
jgi:hypothetical protein